MSFCRLPALTTLRAWLRVGIYVEDSYVRAVRGGIGFAKTGGNYAASILAGMNAKHIGYAQVLWLDGVHQRYIEEVGRDEHDVRL